jgi:16S rRNA (uracil1498-N3)-methyltransferase
MHLFYQELLKSGNNWIEEEEHEHCTRVLRRVTGDYIHVTDGCGLLAKARITKVEKKKTTFEILEKQSVSPKDFSIHIAICPTKQLDRMEWFVEKASELGVDRISFMRSRNSIRDNLKIERLEKKTISALKQSKGAWKTQITPMCDYQSVIKKAHEEIRLIAAVSDDNSYVLDKVIPGKQVIILIGPEGDFTSEEIASAKTNGFDSVNLGSRILRTETAGVCVGQMVNAINRY